MPASSLHLDMLFLSGVYLLKKKLFQICNLFLGIKKGHEVNIVFLGEDAQIALQKLSAEIENGLGE